MKNNHNNFTAFLIVATLYIFPIAGCTSGSPQPVNVDSQGVAIKGYDTVAYFTLAEPVKGSREFEHRWNGARWRFANAEHLNFFKNAPEKYAPRYGGY